MSKNKIQEWFWWYLLSNDQACRDALVELFYQQTVDERYTLHTNHNNKSGFSRAHAKLGCQLAQALLSGKTLTEEDMEKARRLVIHYHKQVSHLLPMPPTLKKENLYA